MQSRVSTKQISRLILDENGLRVRYNTLQRDKEVRKQR